MLWLKKIRIEAMEREHFSWYKVDCGQSVMSLSIESMPY
jgi:hypothetical protein